MSGNGSTASVKPALRIGDVSKAFGGTQALDEVSFELTPGTIHALLGGNGSGKSTLVKILAGVVEADSGEIEIHGRRLGIHELSPAVSQNLGLHFVHQQASTFPALTVAENLAIGRGFETGWGGMIKGRGLRRHAREVLARFQLECTPETPLSSLSPAARTVVAIARALQDQEGASKGILVLDEPTAALPKPEVDLLLTALKRFARAGQSILYVTHRLEEATKIADRATVLRDGRLAATVEHFDHGDLASLIMGQEMANLEVPERHDDDQSTIFRAHEIVAGPLQGVSFTLYAGEVLGIAGILGSGRSTLLRAAFGAHRVQSGSFALDGVPVAFDHPKEAVKAGIAFIPEDRAGEAAFSSLDLTENMSAANVRDFWRHGRLDASSEAHSTRELMRSFSVTASSERAPFTSLSGGNQQKAILARWLRRNPRVLLLDEPTQGVDIGARVEIWKLVRRAVESGAAAIVVSSDFEELASTCDRAIVLRNGQVVGTLTDKRLTEDNLNQTSYASGMVTTPSRGVSR